ncbi:hypothetical protein G5714_000124 [Onychostoma macrolepis]|uniref:Uncharacterized protein n=1 Tax=Onychostoma macrolepis TaxID=369639 RepID=A0A7J6DFG6_9TELE|nr:hypothetical protein G5714_000124 [Onychostoma macrolepis]
MVFNTVGVPARFVSARDALGAGWRYWVRQARPLAPLIVAGALQLRRPPLGRCGFCSFVSHHWGAAAWRALPEALQPP